MGTFCAHAVDAGRTFEGNCEVIGTDTDRLVLGVAINITDLQSLNL